MTPPQSLVQNGPQVGLACVPLGDRPSVQAKIARLADAQAAVLCYSL